MCVAGPIQWISRGRSAQWIPLGSASRRGRVLWAEAGVGSARCDRPRLAMRDRPGRLKSARSSWRELRRLKRRSKRACHDPSRAVWFGGTILWNFESELTNFMDLENEVLAINPVKIIGAVKLNTTNIKLQLSNETRIWKVLYSNKIHSLAKSTMESTYEYFRTLQRSVASKVQ